MKNFKGIYGIIFFILLHFYGQCYGNQELVDYMAQNLDIRYKVLENYDFGIPIHFRGQLNITNTGNDAITDRLWELYFSHARILQLLRFVDNAPLGDGLRVSHINGYLHMIEPTITFSGIPSGETLVVDFIAETSQVARSDVMPNWYVTAPQSEARTIVSTSGESLDFVAPFIEEKQYKRRSTDLYKPYTPEERYKTLDARDLGYSPKRILPTPFWESWDDDMRIQINTGDWVVVQGDESLEADAEFLAEKLGGIPVVPPNEAPGSYYILLDVLEGDDQIPTPRPDTSLEAYRMNVTNMPSSVVIEGNSPDGVFRGVISLLALSEDPLGIAAGSMLDYPRFPYRGQHVDTARNFKPKDEILKILEVMSMYKMNKFHFHLTDDEGWRLDIPGLEELTEVGGKRCHDLEETQCIISQLGSGPGSGNLGSGYYTIDDYQEILDYAQTRHIQVIPEFDMPGHAHAAIKSMEARYWRYMDDGDETKAEEYLLTDFDDNSRYLSLQFFNDGAINPCMESTYNFVEHIVEEIIQIHENHQPLTVFNFGGDEVAPRAWTNSTICAELMENDPELNSTSDLQEYFIRRVSVIAQDNGLDLAGWEDGLMHRRDPYDREVLHNDNVYAYAWNNVWELGLAEIAYKLANAEYKTIISHATHLYFDHPYEPDPEERGYYWATRFANTEKVFSYMPDDVYENIDKTLMGEVIDKDELCDRFSCVELDEDKEENIIGLQGHIWCEVVRTPSQTDRAIFPKMLALAERAWHRAEWEAQRDVNTDKHKRDKSREDDWEQFANTLGHQELARLDKLGVDYQIPEPGVVVTEENTLQTQSSYPGLSIVRSLDGGKTWGQIDSNEEIPWDTTVILATRSADGRRYSRHVGVTTNPPPPVEPQPGSTMSLKSHIMSSLLVFITILFL